MEKMKHYQYIVYRICDRAVALCSPLATLRYPKRVLVSFDCFLFYSCQIIYRTFRNGLMDLPVVPWFSFCEVYVAFQIHQFV